MTPRELKAFFAKVKRAENEYSLLEFVENKMAIKEATQSINDVIRQVRDVGVIETLQAVECLEHAKDHLRIVRDIIERQYRARLRSKEAQPDFRDSEPDSAAGSATQS